MFIMTRAVSTPRDVERRDGGSVFCETILRYLTGSHMTISSKSNYRVRLNVDMDIADSISFYFNFGKGYHFVLRLKQHFFDKARFF